MTKRVLDRIGHGGYVLLFAGSMLIANQNIWGWPIHIAGDAVWIWIGWKLQMRSIVLWQLAFVANAAWGLWVWTR